LALQALWALAHIIISLCHETVVTMPMKTASALLKGKFYVSIAIYQKKITQWGTAGGGILAIVLKRLKRDWHLNVNVSESHNNPVPVPPHIERPQHVYAPQAQHVDTHTACPSADAA